jgi:hypothetical protein
VARPLEAVGWGLPEATCDEPLTRAVCAAIPDAARAAPGAPCEIEIVVRPGRGGFTRRAECRLVIATPDAVLDRALVRRADQVARATPAEVGPLLAHIG